LLRLIVGVIALSLLPGSVSAWPFDLMHLLGRDARRLVPRSLARLLFEREDEILERLRRFPPELAQPLARDMTDGGLRRETLETLDAEAGAIVELLMTKRVHEGLIRLGVLLRVPADLADPALASGRRAYPPGVVREYYAFIGSNLGKIPVVLEDERALELERAELAGYWQSLAKRSHEHAPLLRDGLFKNGRLVDHRTLDYRSPVFGVGSISYSRAVTAIAATWLALWREAGGDPTRTPPRTRVKAR
jgi:ribosome modulation factor